MEEHLNAITYAAAQSDRWLFVALLVIGVFCITFLFRWFTKRLEKVEAKMDEQNKEFVFHLQTANKEMLEVLNIANQTINRNTIIMERIENKLNKE
jgi:type VI protein secretion system component VasK